MHIGTKIDMRVVILGLDGAGKTSILSAMRGITLSGPPIPTIGFNVESLEYKNLVFTLWDVGGQQKFRPLWKHYYHNTQAVIFVVDAGDRSRFEEAQNELSKIANERELKDVLFLIYANKQVRTIGTASVDWLISIGINETLSFVGSKGRGYLRQCRGINRHTLLAKAVLRKSMAHTGFFPGNECL